MSHQVKIFKKQSRARHQGGRALFFAHVQNPKGWTYAEANAYAQAVSNYSSKTYTGRIWISLKYKTGWYDQRGGSTALGAPVHLFTFDDYDDENAVTYKEDKFHQMEFWIERHPVKKTKKKVMVV